MTEVKILGKKYYSSTGAMCTSGRQSRAYSSFTFKEDLGNYSYYDNKSIGFLFDTADYCPVAKGFNKKVISSVNGTTDPLLNEEYRKAFNETMKSMKGWTTDDEDEIGGDHIND